MRNPALLLFSVLTFIILCSISACSDASMDDKMKYKKSKSWSISTIDTTERFVFHSDFWVNLHYFLYEYGMGKQGRKLKEDGSTFLNIGDDLAMGQMSNEELSMFKEVADFYQEQFDTLSVVFEMGPLHVWLREQDDNQPLPSDTIISEAHRKQLNLIAKLYRLRLWPIHDAHNQQMLREHLSTIRSLESSVISAMELLADYPWPANTKVRVDLTAHANYAGAFTISRPSMNIIISTKDPHVKTSSFIETVFHEGSHLLYGIDDSPFRAAIFHQSKAMDMRFPRGLWHAAMFYLSGRVVQDHLKPQGVEHVMLMDEKNIFSRYNTLSFQEILEKYYQKTVTMDTTVQALLLDLQQR